MQPSLGHPDEILIVDDDQDNRSVYAMLLADAGYAVREAADGERCLNAVAQKMPSLIVLDVSMPGMDGFETADRIRGGERNNDVPIIFVTAYGRDDTDTLTAYASGAVDFIFTPVRPDVLRAKVSVFVDLFLKNADQAERLSRRVADVEETAAHLSEIPSVSKDPETEDALAELVRRVGKLRDVLDDMTGLGDPPVAGDV